MEPGSRVRAWGGAVLDLLLPPHCLACDNPVGEHGALCAGCFGGLHVIVAPFCDRCGVPFLHAGQAARGAGKPRCERCAAAPPPWNLARAAFAYGESVKRLILPLKHGDRPDLAGPLAAQMARAGAELLARADWIVPVPLHWRRLLGRRYNQAGLLAAALSRRSGVPWSPDLLRRARATASLGHRGGAERAALLDGAFAVPARAAARIAGRRLLLVDDVLTSGATAGACAAALRNAGAASVDLLVAARVPDPRLADARAA